MLQLQEANFPEHNIPLQQPSVSFCRRFLLAEIHSATRYFDEEFVIGKGGFGKVYRGAIDHDASTVAIKRLDHNKSKQGATEFWTEIKMLSKFRHSHLVSLIGYCSEGDEMILVYEYMPRGSLSDHLHKVGTPLTWEQRLKICIGAARGLDYLHTGTGIQDRVIHRDVKSSNILLDNDFEARISDFGLSKVGPANQLCTHVSTLHIKGTSGYMDPDYLLTWKLTRKSDVYAFGVVLFEMICGRMAVDLSLEEDQWSLAGWAQHCVKKGTLDQIIDPRLRGQILTDCLTEFGQVAGQCVHKNPRKRPTMAEVVARLEYSLTLQERTDISVVERELGHIAWAVEKEEIASNARASDDQGKAEFPTDQESTPSSGWKGREQIDSIAPQADAMAGRSRLKHKGIMTFTRMSRKLRRLLFGEDRMISELKAGLYGKFLNFEQIKVATQNFSINNKLGEGGFGSVYKGILSDGSTIAVKQCSAKSRQGVHEFVNEIGTLSTLQHPNLVKLLGCCAEKHQRLLIYEYMENNSLGHALFRSKELKLRLNWATRVNICRGIAKGLTFLHEESVLRIVHRDIKLTNILLDKDLTAKISDFGLAKLYEEEDSHISTRIAGTMGYMAPEYAMRGHLTYKADVYSYGVVLLEIVSGKNSASHLPNDESVYLLDLACILQKEGNLVKLVDPALGGDYSWDEANTILKLALLCTNPSYKLRPNMSKVVKILEGEIKIDNYTTGREHYSIDDSAMAKLIAGLSQSGSTSGEDKIVHSTFESEATTETINLSAQQVILQPTGKRTVFPNDTPSPSPTKESAAPTTATAAVPTTTTVVPDTTADPSTSTPVVPTHLFPEGSTYYEALDTLMITQVHIKEDLKDMNQQMNQQIQGVQQQMNQQVQGLQMQIEALLPSLQDTISAAVQAAFSAGESTALKAFKEEEEKQRAEGLAHKEEEEKKKARAKKG